MIEDKCEHVWRKHTNASRQADVGAIPAYYICAKCEVLMTAEEVFKLEELKNKQSEEEIVKLSPEIHGVGLDLKALWRKLRRARK